MNKTAFRKKRLPICMLVITGTFVSTFSVATIIYFSTRQFQSIVTFPLMESLAFGALISSIDPTAMLNVLSTLNIPDTDTVHIVILGESLLNDAIVISLFKSIITEGTDSWDMKTVLIVLVDFIVTFFGSITVALVIGLLCLGYFRLLHTKLTPAMEVVSFFSWAAIPYYISDALQWSGIVALVTIGFFLDTYIAGGAQTNDNDLDSVEVEMGNIGDFLSNQTNQVSNCTGDLCHDVFASEDRAYATKYLYLAEFEYTMSTEAYKHVKFVASLLASLTKDVMFAYVGLFIFNENYSWDFGLMMISISSCIISRCITIAAVSGLVWYSHQFWQRYRHRRRPDDMNLNPGISQHEAYVRYRQNEAFPIHDDAYRAPSVEVGNKVKVDNVLTSTSTNLSYLEGDSLNYSSGIPLSYLDGDSLSSAIAPVTVSTQDNGEKYFASYAVQELQNRSVQLVLVLSGIRGAVSFALAESLPLYDEDTDQGTSLKPEIRAMTSSVIIFSMFVFGGSALPIVRRLNLV